MTHHQFAIAEFCLTCIDNDGIGKKETRGPSNYDTPLTVTASTIAAAVSQLLGAGNCLGNPQSALALLLEAMEELERRGVLEGYTITENVNYAELADGRKVLHSLGWTFEKGAWTCFPYKDRHCETAPQQAVSDGRCEWCHNVHLDRPCPAVKAIEYEVGSVVKRVEFWPSSEWPQVP